MAAKQEQFLLKYFPVSCDIWDDEKIIKLSERFPNALMLYILILCKLYKTSGYYIHWSETMCEVFCKRHKLDQYMLEDFIFQALEIDLFDKLCFFNYSILTSVRIQKTYYGAWDRRRFFKFQYKLFLLNINDYSRDKTQKGAGIIIFIDDEKNEIKGDLSPKQNILNTYPIYQKSSPSVKIDLFHNEKNEETEYIQLPPTPTQRPATISTTTPWQDMVLFSRIEYENQIHEIKKSMKRSYYVSYQEFIRIVDEECPALTCTTFPVRWDKWNELIYKKEFTKVQIYAGLEKLAANGIGEKADMYLKLIQYIQWAIDPNWGKESNDTSTKNGSSANPGIEIKFDARPKK